MREKRTSQLNMDHIIPNNPTGRELQAISEVLQENPVIFDLAFGALTAGKARETGRMAMNAEQVVRSAILKQHYHLTYEELSFHLQDSRSFRAFARLFPGQFPSASTLQENIKALSDDTWEAINKVLVHYGAANKMERGRSIRMDSTGVESNIHYPTDSTLLQDGVRLITRLLNEGKRLRPQPQYAFSDHQRAVKRRVLKIHSTTKEKERRRAYGQLLDIARQVRGYALEAIAVLRAHDGEGVEEMVRARLLAEQLERIVSIFDRVVDQTRRRVMRGEKVPASEKVVSFFESHTDIIEKGRRETLYGHKVFLTGGASGLILDCTIERGNPADSAMFKPLMERQRELFGRPPRQAAADAGFASKDNLHWAKGFGIKDMAFSKRKGLSVLEMVKSSWVYKKLKNFRAGIEGNISRLKRAFGLTRCNWTGWDGFRQYVWSAVVSYNLSVLARLKLAML